jgi:hypothetical protein
MAYVAHLADHLALNTRECLKDHHHRGEAAYHFVAQSPRAAWTFFMPIVCIKGIEEHESVVSIRRCWIKGQQGQQMGEMPREARRSRH